MTPLEQLTALFEGEGLPSPPVPAAIAGRLVPAGARAWSTDGTPPGDAIIAAGTAATGEDFARYGWDGLDRAVHVHVASGPVAVLIGFSFRGDAEGKAASRQRAADLVPKAADLLSLDLSQLDLEAGHRLIVGDDVTDEPFTAVVDLPADRRALAQALRDGIDPLGEALARGR